LTTVAPQELRINEEYASIVPKISDVEYEPIKQSIKEHGQHVPIVVNRKGEILDGITRNRICQELGIEVRTILCPAEYEDPLFAKQFIISINHDRRHLNDFQKGELQYKLHHYKTEIEAKVRQASTIPEKGQKGFQPVSVSHDTHTEKGRSREIIARKTGLSPATYSRIVKLIEKAPEDVKEKLRKEKAKIFKESKRLQFEENMYPHSLLFGN